MLKLHSLVNRRLFGTSFVLSKNKKNKKIKPGLLELLTSMPKEEATLEVIRKMRVEKRIKRSLVQPSVVYWQVGTYKEGKVKPCSHSGAG